MRMKCSNMCFILSVCIVLYIPSIFARQKPETVDRKLVPQSSADQAQTATQFHGYQQGFNMKLWMGNLGVVGLGYDYGGVSNGYGLAYPSNSGYEHLYGAGLWIGALIDTSTTDTAHVIKKVTTTYEGWYGPLYEMFGNPNGSDSFYITGIDNSNGKNQKDFDDDNDGKVDDDELDGIDNDGDSVIDEDYGALSHNDAYVSYADNYGSPLVAGHIPLGIKVFQKSHVWHAGTSADAIIVMDYTIINVGNRNLKDVYVGFFADVDVGPRNVYNYYSRNSAGFFSDLNTAYAFNSVDQPSTPIGVTILDHSQSIDSLKFTFSWYSAGSTPGNDALRYNVMSSGLIKPDQYPSVSDTRLLFSYGPFNGNDVASGFTLGDTLRLVVAFVSGTTVGDGKNNLRNNAIMAKRIYDAGGFIPPIISITDSGNGSGITIQWEGLDRSPYGAVKGYRLYYGLSDEEDKDSAQTTNTSIGISGLMAGSQYSFSILAEDEHQHLSAISQKTIFPMHSFIPRAPASIGVLAFDDVIYMSWGGPIHELDVHNWNIYRRDNIDTGWVKQNKSLNNTAKYWDTAVWGNRTYYYKATAVDDDGNESGFSPVVSGHLKAPAAPAYVFLGPGKNFIRLQWAHNTEPDLAGYNVYRSTDTLAEYQQVNRQLLTKEDFIDKDIQSGIEYYYFIEAVDTTEAVSSWSRRVSGYTTIMDQGILADLYAIYPVAAETLFYNGILHYYPVTTVRGNPLHLFDSASIYTLGKYSTVIWVQEYTVLYGLSSPYPRGLRSYLLGGGKAIIICKDPKFTGSPSPDWPAFLRDVFGVHAINKSDSANFFSASGENSYPTVTVDTMKLVSTHGRMSFVEYFPGMPDEQVIYRFHSDPYDSLVEGQPVGIIPADTSIHAVFLTFPLYYMDSTDAKDLITKLLGDFGEVTDVSESDHAIPHEFRLYEAYPNPFNPTAHIQFSIPISQFVVLKVYDILGREVATLINEQKPPGKYDIEWNANGLASGVYFYRMQAGSFVDVKKMLLLR